MRTDEHAEEVMDQVHSGVHSLQDEIDDDDDADVLGDSFGQTILNVLAEGAQKGYGAYSQDAADKAAADNVKKSVAKQVADAKAADDGLAAAETALELATMRGDKVALDAATTIANMARVQATLAGQGISPEASQQRLAYARQRATAAAQDALVAPADKNKQATMHAWQKVLVAASGVEVQQGYSADDLARARAAMQDGSGGWQKPLMYGGIVVGAGGIGYLVYRLLFKRRY